MCDGVSNDCSYSTIPVVSSVKLAADEEVSQMLEELAYQATSRGQKAPTHVDLQQFLSLYLNYRPALQEPSDEVSQAFAALEADPTTGK